MLHYRNSRLQGIPTRRPSFADEARSQHAGRNRGHEARRDVEPERPNWPQDDGCVAASLGVQATIVGEEPYRKDSQAHPPSALAKALRETTERSTAP